MKRSFMPFAQPGPVERLREGFVSMPIQNKDIADIFKKVADLLDIAGENRFRVRAYRNAARTLSSLPHDVGEMVDKDRDLTELAGIGDDLAGKIKEILRTGRLSQLEKLEKEHTAEIGELLNISSLGPKRVKALHEELGITSLKDLKKAAEAGDIRNVQGFGKKTEQTILESIDRAAEDEQRTKRADAEQRVRALVAYLERNGDVKDICVAGSYRRRKETVGDLDILATCRRGSDIMPYFVQYEDVRKVISKGKTKSSVVLKSGLQVDLRVVPGVGYGAAMHYFTGSKAHNIAVRKLGVKKGLKINEYGVYKGKKRIAGKTEAEVFEQVGLPYIEPELREDRGEIEAAKQKRLPRLVEWKDIRGDLHAHTNRTDGHDSLEKMAEAARSLGYRYLAVTEHSKRVSVAGGLDADALRGMIQKIDRLNEKLDGIVLLKSAEVDILKSGKLDLPDDILKELDLTVCSVHYHRNLPRDRQTERIIRAMDNPFFNVLGHPSGRLINARSAYAVDMEKILRAAKERNCVLEVNAHPDRLDLDDGHCRMAKEMAVKLAISTDAHSATDLNFMRYGVDQARRGWIEKKDVVNTRSLRDLKKLLKRR